MRLLIAVFIASAVAGGAEPAQAARERSTVSVADFANPQSPTGGVQEAIDTLPAAGGLVVIPPGEYLLRRSIRLRSNVTLQGAGPSTILRKNKQVFGKLTAPAAKGSRSVRVERADQFPVGGEVILQEYECYGGCVEHMIVEGATGDELRFNRPLSRTFDPAKGAYAVNFFSAITAYAASGILIKDLAIDGRRDENPGPPAAHVEAYFPPVSRITIPGFTCGAIHLVKATGSRVEGCQINGWFSDGVSMQGGSGNTVTRCLVENGRRIGFHPGGGLSDSVFSQNVGRGNGEQGLYFCANVRRVIVSDNVFVGNKTHGIGGLGDWDDKYNTVSNNIIAENGAHGIQVNGGEGNTVVNNTCLNNSQSAPGRYSGIFLSNTSATIVTGNRCQDDQKTKTQKHGIEELPSSQRSLIANNLCFGNAEADVVLAGSKETAQGRKKPAR